jgi:hypothetical protein
MVFHPVDTTAKRLMSNVGKVQNAQSDKRATLKFVTDRVRITLEQGRLQRQCWRIGIGSIPLAVPRSWLCCGVQSMCRGAQGRIGG